MAGVTWVELPPDAPEPPPLSVVRDKFGWMWFHMEEADEEPRSWCGVSAGNAGDLTEVVGVQRPLSLGQPEGVPWPLVESVEPSPYEVRHAALNAAANYAGKRPTDWTPEAVVEAARVFEPYLRVEPLPRRP